MSPLQKGGETYCGRTRAKSCCMQGQVLVLSLEDQETKNTNQCTQKKVQHGGASIIILACFSYYAVGPIHWVKMILDQHAYVDILQNVMLPYAELEMPFIWVYQQDNDPKHMSKKAKKWFADNIIDVMEWPPKSPISIQFRI